MPLQPHVSPDARVKLTCHCRDCDLIEKQAWDKWEGSYNDPWIGWCDVDKANAAYTAHLKTAKHGWKVI